MNDKQSKCTKSLWVSEVFVANIIWRGYNGVEEFRERSKMIERFMKYTEITIGNVEIFITLLRSKCERNENRNGGAKKSAFQRRRH